MQISTSAGGIIIGPTNQVVVVNQNGVSWSLPKGRLEFGEDEFGAAKREIYEETGISEFVLIKKLGTYERFLIGKGGKGEDKTVKKLITFYLFITNQKALRPQDPDNPEARWVNPDKVADLLTHPEDINFYNSKLPDIQAVIDSKFPASN